MFNRLIRLLSLTLTIAALLLPRPALAQSGASGNIEGVVTDASGGVLPGVAVVVKNLDTNVARDLVTDDGGRYRAPALQPGRYEVSATLSGFQVAPITNITVQVGQTQAVDLKMRPAGVNEVVTVSGEAPIIDTRRTDVGNVIGQDAIQNLPINGRRWENFVLLSPGVTNDGGFGLVSYRGISGLYNNNSVDGVDNNQAFFSEARGRTRTAYSVSQAAIKEFQVGISNFSAEFGRAAGGSVNAVTKSGTNKVTGEGFYYLRSDAFQARDPFALSTLPKPEEKRQQFGAAVGGPIQQNKIFFFANYDGQRRNFPATINFHDDLLLHRRVHGARAAPPRSTIYKSLKGIDPRSGTNDVGFGKVDFALSPKNNLSVQYNMHRWNSPNGVQTAPVITRLALRQRHRHRQDRLRGGVAEYRAVADLAERGAGPDRPRLRAAAAERSRPEHLGDQRPEHRNAELPAAREVSRRAALRVHRQRHALPRRAQPEGRRRHQLRAGEPDQPVLGRRRLLVSRTSDAIASDCPSLATGCVPLTTGAATDLRHYTHGFVQAFDLRGPSFQGDVYFPTTDYNMFVQDTWKATNALTLNLGLRYEYQKLPQPGHVSVNGTVENGNPAYPATMTFNQDKNNFGPRLGFTYDCKGEHRTVVRGGWGIYYGRTSNSAISSALTNNAVTLASYTFSADQPGRARVSR